MKYLFYLLLLLCIFIPEISAQSSTSGTVPKDPELRYGKLTNGITYYIRKNNKPEKRASFYIVRNAGALLEEDDQNGMAHFLEHMAFNGTKNFPGESLINTLERKGITFGQKINGYTNFNETVYNLTDIQVDDPGLIDTCLLILHDWSAYISLMDEEIDKERGVIAEEYRTRKSGNLRIYFQTLKFLLQGSKYAERDIIGDMNVILKGSPQRLRDLYRDWYRTDLQAIIIVGDLDPAEMESKVIRTFSPLPVVENPKERPFFRIPYHEGTRFTVITDKEATRSSITSYTLFESGPDYKEDVTFMEKFTLISLFNSMARARITELLQKAEDPPFITGTIAYGNYHKGYEVFYVSASCDASKEQKAIEGIQTEVERIKRYGFTEQELGRAKEELLAQLDKEYKSEKFNEEFVEDYKDNFLLGIPIPSKDYMYERSKIIAENISIEMINKMVDLWTTEDNRTFIITGEENDSVNHLSENQVFDILAKVKNLDLDPYRDEDISKPLIAEELKGTGIIREKRLKDFQAVEWTLGNNAKVVYRYSDLEKNNITMAAFSPGGTSLYPADMLESAGLVTYMMPWYGLGDFDAIALQKKLKGKNVSLTPVFGGNECIEGFRGSSTPEDFETLLQLLYLYFEKPRFDRKAFDNIIKRNLEAAANRYNDPANVINDSMILILNDYNERIKLSGTRDYYLRADFDVIEKIYRDRIRDAGDFIFFFVGNINADSAKHLIERYIGSIKDDPRKEKWIDNRVRWPEGKILKEIEVKMTEPKTTVLVNYNSYLKYTPYNMMLLDIVSRILQITFTETIREKEGGTYGVYCDGSLKHYPVSEASFMIYFDCKPDNAEKLSGIVSGEIEKLRSGGPSGENLKKAVLAIRKEREEALKRNAFWNSALYSYYYDKINSVSSKNFEGILDRMDISKVQKFSDKFFSGSDRVEIRFKPPEE